MSPLLCHLIQLLNYCLRTTTSSWVSAITFFTCSFFPLFHFPLAFIPFYPPLSLYPKAFLHCSLHLPAILRALLCSEIPKKDLRYFYGWTKYSHSNFDTSTVSIQNVHMYVSIYIYKMCTYFLVTRTYPLTNLYVWIQCSRILII